MDTPILCTTFSLVHDPLILSKNDSSDSNFHRSPFNIYDRHLWNLSVLKLSFVNGTQEEQGFVRSVAYEWISEERKHHDKIIDGFKGSKFYDEHKNYQLNFTFKWVEKSEDADVKIQFGDLCHSCIGTTGSNVVNIHMFKCSDPERQLAWRRYNVLHQFGHLLGLVHEFQYEGLFSFTKEIYSSGLSTEFINREIVPKYEFCPMIAPNGYDLDKDSIMVYPLKRNWIKNDKTLIDHPILVDVDGLPYSKLSISDLEWFLIKYGKSIEFDLN